MGLALSTFEPDFAAPGDWATMYRERGLQVVPSYAPAEHQSWKRPRLADWKTLQEALAPADTFRRWYGQGGEHAGRANMGLLTGRSSGNIFVIDLDDYKDVRARLWWQGVLTEHNYGRELETWQQVTGGGGRQLFFRARPDWHAPTNRTPIGVDIRGQGGFAVLPPSLHESGKAYAWRIGCAPYEIEIEDAPEWLLAAVEQLVAQHGGDTSREPGAPAQRTASPGTDFDAFGARVDGREEYMRDVVWAAVADLRRTCPIQPVGAELEQECRRAFEVFLDNVKARIPGVDREAALEREGRGWSAFRRKWAYAMAQWDGDVRKAAEARPLEAQAEQRAEEAVSAALEPKPDADPTDNGIATPFEWVDPSSIPPRAWIYGRHYIRKFVSTTVAPGGVGKTALGVVEALAIASGKPLLGVQPDERTAVWLWNGEDPLEELQRRVMAAAMHYGMAPGDVRGRLFVDTGRVTPIVIAEKTRDGATINAPIIERVVHTIRANKIGLMAIDPFVACHRVTENDNSEIERVAKAWAQIADATNCAIELVHHVRKTNGNEVSVEDGRGATALLAAARAARALNRMTADEAVKAGVTEPGLYFRTDNGKANLAPPSAVATWYHLTSIDLDNDTPATADEPARPGDKVGVVTRWEWPDPTADVTTSDMEMVRAAVRQGMWREDPQADQWVGKLVIRTLGWEADEPANAHKAKALISMWLKTGALETYRAKDPETRKDKSFVRAGTFKD